MKRCFWFLICLPLVVGLVAVQPGSAIGSGDCLATGEYLLSATRDTCLVGGWSVCQAYVNLPNKPGKLMLYTGIFIMPNTDACALELEAEINCVDGSISAPSYEGLSAGGLFEYNVYLQAFNGMLLTPHSFRVSITYRWDCPCSGATCYCATLGDCGPRTFTFEGVLSTVPVEKTSWGAVKALFTK